MDGDALDRERRCASRFARHPDSDFAKLWLAQDDGSHTVEVHDESLGGISVFVDEALPIQVDDRVRLQYSGTIYQCQVRHVTTGSEGRALVGLSCQEGNISPGPT